MSEQRPPVSILARSRFVEGLSAWLARHVEEGTSLAELAPDDLATVEVKAFLESIGHSVGVGDWARCPDVAGLYAGYRDQRAVAAVGWRT